MDYPFCPCLFQKIFVRDSSLGTEGTKYEINKKKGAHDSLRFMVVNLVENKNTKLGTLYQKLMAQSQQMIINDQ